jgi:Transposase
VPPTPTSKEETVALPTLPHPQVLVTLGVDTHADSHVAAALDQAGRPLGTRTISTTPGGYAALGGWATGFGTVDRIGVEGTGSYGAGLARWLRAHGQLVIEVDRPDRAARRRQGKADDLDAHAAARAVQAGTATGQPKAGDGTVEMIRSLRLARRSAVKARTQAANQLKALLVTAPDRLRAQLRRLPPAELVTTAARLRAATKPATPTDAAKLALRSIARRWLQLTRRSPRSTPSWSGWSPWRRRRWWRSKAWAPRRPPCCWSRPGTIPSGCAARPRSRICAGSRRSLPHPARSPGTG